MSAEDAGLRHLALHTRRYPGKLATPKYSIQAHPSRALVPQPTRLADSVYFPGASYFLGPEAPPDEAKIQRTLERGKVVALIGQVMQVNRSAGEWSLFTDHGLKAGRTTPGGPGLNGLQIGKHYRFKCAEATEPDPLWRDQKTLYLQSIGTAGIARKRPRTALHGMTSSGAPKQSGGAEIRAAAPWVPYRRNPGRGWRLRLL